MQTLSARLPAEDFEWLMSLDIQGAVSPSDKLRALMAQMRRQHEGTMDYAACVAWLRDLLAPSVTALRSVEHQHRMHSEALTLAAEWLPEIMATLLSARSARGVGRDEALELEDVVVQRCFRFLASLLRLGVTREAPCYNPGVIERHVAAALETAEIVAQSRKSRKE